MSNKMGNIGKQKLPQGIQQLYEQQRFGPNHELWDAKIEWGSTLYPGQIEKLGGYNDKWAFMVETDLSGRKEPILVIAPCEHQAGALFFDWDKSTRREMSAADIGALTTVLAASLEEMEAKKPSADQLSKIADKIPQLAAMKNGLPTDLAAQIDSVVESLKRTLTNPSTDMQEKTEELLMRVNNPNNWPLGPISKSGIQEGQSLLARRMKGEI